MVDERGIATANALRLEGQACRPGKVRQRLQVVAGYALQDGVVIPTLRGRAHMAADATLLIEADDPFGWGIRL